MHIHKPVLLKETIEKLNLKEGDTVVDSTLGSGGHTEEILKKIGTEGRLIAIDLDKNNIERFKLKIKERIFLVKDNFRNIEKILEDLGIEKVDAILADLGYSSDQLEDPRYGMSFRLEAPLDMRISGEGELNAGKVVNGYPEEKLEKIIRKYGEEKFSRRIARKIVEARKEAPIETTRELSEIVRSAVPERYRQGRINPAARTFQAIRIEVNDELNNLEEFIEGAIPSLRSGGRLAVITFHSLEDRIVKNKFRENARGCICPSAVQLEKLQKAYIQAVETDDPSMKKLEKALQEGNFGLSGKIFDDSPVLRLVTKKPLMACEAEIQNNTRARSAKLRVAEKI